MLGFMMTFGALCAAFTPDFPFLALGAWASFELCALIVVDAIRADVLTKAGARRYDAWEEERNVLEEER